MQKKDILWVLAYPIYQIIGTFRHEASHAVFALLQGAIIDEFVFLPSLRDGGGVIWGYVRWTGSTDWLTTAAPYFCDLVTYVFFFWICSNICFTRRWVWLNMVIIGLLSPLINSTYNYLGGFQGNNDIGYLLNVLPDNMVHIYLILTIVLYISGLVLVVRKKHRTAVKV